MGMKLEVGARITNNQAPTNPYQRRLMSPAKVRSKSDKMIKPGPNFEERAAAVSPLRNLTATTPPILIMQGEQDRIVLPEEAKAFHEACRKLGVDSEYISWPDANHAFIVTGYTATDAQISRALLAADTFLTERGLLDGEPSLSR